LEHHQEVHVAKVTSHVIAPQTAVFVAESTKVAAKLAAATQLILVIYGATVAIPAKSISVPTLIVSALSYAGNYPSTPGVPTNWFMNQVEAQQEPLSKAAPPSLLVLSGVASRVINPVCPKSFAWSVDVER